ncbi:MAG TPA: helix-turn-helix transcriptional regulator, partial [Vicinamibacterales bacterium]|nr:helix-turn-helix transcriptional regulator [Vicinamibacterales bacterium]
MTPLSQRLRQAREQAGLSLADLSARTKIRVSHLDAIERGAFDRLPGGIFTRGYLRAYAREVGLDPEAVVRDYLAEHAGTMAEPGGEWRAETWPRRDPLLDEPDRLRQFWAAMIVGAVVLVVVGFLSGD